MSQYLPISIAVQWGWLAYAGIFVLVAAWLLLTWPRVVKHGEGERQSTEDFHLVAARMLWFVLFFAALDASLINLLLIQPHGAGMPLLSGNWGWILIAGVLMGLNTYRQSTPATKSLIQDSETTTKYSDNSPKSSHPTEQPFP